MESTRVRVLFPAGSLHSGLPEVGPHVRPGPALRAVGAVRTAYQHPPEAAHGAAAAAAAGDDEQPADGPCGDGGELPLKAAALGELGVGGAAAGEEEHLDLAGEREG